MDVKIGDKELIDSSSVMLFNDEDAWISFDVDGWNIRVNVITEIDEENKSSRFTFKGVNDYAELRIINLNKHTPFASQSYLKIGETKLKNEIYLMLSGQKHGQIFKLDIAFLKKVKNEQ